MSGSQAIGVRARHRGRVAALAARAGAWLLEPAEDRGAEREPAAGPGATRRLVVVAGIRQGAGATTVARALGVELALRDPAAACAVAADAPLAGLPLATSQATRLAAAVERRSGAPARASGRLCLVSCAGAADAERAVGGLAPLVVDGGRAAHVAASMSVAGAAVLVAGPDAEPALAAVVAERLARVGPRPLVVLNGAGEEAPEPWRDRADVFVPNARAAARLALAGRLPGGAFAAAISDLATACT